MSKTRMIIAVIVSVVAVVSPVAEFAQAETTLTYWLELHKNTAQITTNLGKTPFAKELEERTGVKVEYLHPALDAKGKPIEAFNLMIASGDLPDLIEYDWFKGFPGGPAKAIEEGYIHRLNDIIDQHAPNFKQYLQDHPDIDKMIKTDEGDYYVFPFLRSQDSLLVTNGDVVRKDWLDDLGMDAPTTIGEWHTMLVAFKEQKGAEAPLVMKFVELIRSFAGAFNTYGGSRIDNSFYVNADGQVRFGIIEPGFKDFYNTMQAWYAEGLIDKNLAVLTRKTQDANILGGKSGATRGSGGSGIGRWMAAMKGKDEKFNLIGIAPAGPEKGKMAEFSGNWSIGYPGYGSVAITTACKDVEAAVKLLDYAYGEEGYMFMNFGIEGMSYNLIDGYPTYSETIFHDPDGLPMAQAMSKYLRGHTRGPFDQDPRYLEQYYALPQQKEAMTAWRTSNQKQYQFPPVTPSVEENAEVSRIMTDITTYIEETGMKFIMGVESLENYDAYVAQVQKMGIDRVLEIYQAALDRYNAR